MDSDACEIPEFVSLHYVRWGLVVVQNSESSCLRLPSAGIIGVHAPQPSSLNQLLRHLLNAYRK